MTAMQMGKAAGGTNAKPGCLVSGGGISPVTLVICGDGAVGKTCVLNRHMNDDFSDGYEPTIFEDWAGEAELENYGLQTCKVTLRDTAGQEAFDAINKASFMNVDAFMIAFSVNSDRFDTSLDNVGAKWIPMVKEASPTARILLVGTQKDWDPVEWASQGSEARRKIDDTCQRYGCKFIATSAKEDKVNGKCQEAVDVASILSAYPQCRYP